MVPAPVTEAHTALASAPAGAALSADPGGAQRPAASVAQPLTSKPIGGLAALTPCSAVYPRAWMEEEQPSYSVPAPCVGVVGALPSYSTPSVFSSVAASSGKSTAAEPQKLFLK